MTTKILTQAQAKSAYDAICIAHESCQEIKIDGDGFVIEYDMLVGGWVKSKTGSVEMFYSPAEFGQMYNLI